MGVKRKLEHKAKARNVYTRERAPTILIIAEGKNKTEKKYFRSFAEAYEKMSISLREAIQIL